MHISFESVMIALVIWDNLLCFYIMILREQKRFKARQTRNIFLILEKIVDEETDKNQKRKFILMRLIFYLSLFLTLVAFCFWIVR